MADSVPIDWTKKYPHLSAAPIVEAVIHWQARAERPWNPEELRAELTKHLPEYTKLEAQHQHEILFALEGSVEGPASSSTSSQRVGWHGFRLSTADGLYIAQFVRDGLVFSRLRPYQDWPTFEAEGRRLWRLFIELAAPSQIQRLGVRFINRIPIRAGARAGDYLRDPPTRPLSLPLKNFLYLSTFDIPDHDFGIDLVKTLQSSGCEGNLTSNLIVDIDVFTKQPMPYDENRIDDRLPRMRTLKNAVFFSLLTDEAIASFHQK
jgi:uncharacterized protein (TIGR04255 family)